MANNKQQKIVRLYYETALPVHNQLIAEFMGWKHIITYPDKYPLGEWELETTIDDGRSYEEDELSFDKSWNSLMRVVEKIDEITGGDTKIYGQWCEIRRGGEWNAIRGESKIDAVYKSVLSFIEYYNV